jgi:hypothetical protein
MLIMKTGYDHKMHDVNCQDYGSKIGSLKIVTDGCSACPHSEVGVKLFHFAMADIERQMPGLLEKKPQEVTEDIFESFLKNTFDTVHSMSDYCLFTILFAREDENEFIVDSCGDGVIILRTKDDELEYKVINNGSYPPYFAYNYMKGHLYTPTEGPDYNNGVKFQTASFSKEQYKNVGIASDGILYILKSVYKDQFEKYFLDGREGQIKRMINEANTRLPERDRFKDDITIVY